MKTRLYTRKRALISSVAMLLVAMIALGTATFAWFTASTTAKAQHINVRTIKASELKVATKNHNYDTVVDYMDETEYEDGKVLLPASSADGATWYTANAADKLSYAASTYSSVPDTTNYVFADELNIRNYGAAAVNDIEIKFHIAETQGGTGNYVRVALVPLDTQGKFNAATFRSNIYAGADENAYYPVYKGSDNKPKVDTAETTNAVKITPDNAAASTFKVETHKNLAGRVTNAEGETTYSSLHYALFIWFEGQDTECLDANSGNALPAISFEVSGNTETQV